MHKCGVYRIRHLDSNRSYVGSSAANLGKRWTIHKSYLGGQKHHSRHLQSAWNKYGEDAFVFEVLLYCDPENCLMYEQIALDHYKPEYNILRTAGSWLGQKHSETTKLRIQNLRRGTTHSEKTKQKMRASHKNLTHQHFQGGTHSQETKLELSKLSIGENNPQAKLSEQDVISIRDRISSGDHVKDIALDYAVSMSTICDIRSRRTWRFLV